MTIQSIGKRTAFILLILHFFSFTARAKSETNATITFKITAPARELTALNDSVFCTMDSSGKVTFKLKMNQFRFVTSFFPDVMNESATQRFNDYYFDTKQFPDCSYTGVIQGMDSIDLHKPGRYQVRCEGLLTMRGISKAVSASGEMIVMEDRIQLKSAFQLDPRAFGMPIPESIERFYMKEVEVFVEATLSNVSIQ